MITMTKERVESIVNVPESVRQVGGGHELGYSAEIVYGDWVKIVEDIVTNRGHGEEFLNHRLSMSSRLGGRDCLFTTFC